MKQHHDQFERSQYINGGFHAKMQGLDDNNEQIQIDKIKTDNYLHADNQTFESTAAVNRRQCTRDALQNKLHNTQPNPFARLEAVKNGQVRRQSEKAKQKMNTIKLHIRNSKKSPN